MKDTMRGAGYKYIRSTYPGYHILEDIETGRRELWANSKNHASYGIKFKNTHLEFVQGINSGYEAMRAISK